MSTNNYQHKAGDYALRGLSGTDLLAFRAISERIQSAYSNHSRALDIGCGSGRSTRFLKKLGLNTVGVDISTPMINEARKLDPHGEYHVYTSNQPLPFNDNHFELFLATWVVLEQANLTMLNKLISEASRILEPDGVGFIVANTPEFYDGNWVSCEVDFPENSPPLVSGQVVKARLMPEGVVVTDIFWSDDDYRMAISKAELNLISAIHPTAPESEQDWSDETRKAPWVIYEVQK